MIIYLKILNCDYRLVVWFKTLSGIYFFANFWITFVRHVNSRSGKIEKIKFIKWSSLYRLGNHQNKITLIKFSQCWIKHFILYLLKAFYLYQFLYQNSSKPMFRTRFLNFNFLGKIANQTTLKPLIDFSRTESVEGINGKFQGVE